MKPVVLLPLLPLVLLLPSACGGDDEVVLEPLGTPEENVASMRERIEEVAARPEHDAELVEVEHVLVGFAEAEGLEGVTRSRDGARRLAAEVYARAARGESFSDLREEHSDDPGGGTYMLSITPAAAPDVHDRSSMVQGFGDVGWRLEVGELGVVPYDPETSPFGWHVVKRIR